MVKLELVYYFLTLLEKLVIQLSAMMAESEPGKENVKYSNKIFTLKVGPEYTLDIPLSPITPYFQGFVSLNTFSGDVEFTGVTGVPSGKYDIASATRVGAGAGVGVLFSLVELNLMPTYNIIL